MNKVLFSFIILMLLIPVIANAEIVLDETLIDESNTIKIPYGANFTKNTDFILCVPTDFSVCSSDFEVNYKYTYGAASKTGYFSTLNETFSTYGLEATEPNIYCGIIDGVSTGSVEINASCFNSNNGKTHRDITTVSVYSAENILHKQSTYYYDYYASPGNSILMNIEYLHTGDFSPTYYSFDADIYYTVRDITTGGIIDQAHNYITLDEYSTYWYDWFEIPVDIPVGIIDFIAKETSTGDFLGGTYTIYKARPFYATLTVSETSPKIQELLSIELTNTLHYGAITDVDTTIEYPNGTEIQITLNETNNYKENFTVPKLTGYYSIQSTITHSTGYTYNEYAYFYANPQYSIDITDIRKIYSRGETVSVSAALVNSTAVAPSEAEFTFADPENYKLLTVKNEDTTVENEYRKAYFDIDSDADIGEYRVDIELKDEYDIIYTKSKYFTVTNSTTTTTTNLEFSPNSIDLDIDSLDEVKTKITITNEGSAIDGIDIDVKNLTGYVSLDTDDFDETLSAGEDTYFYIVITPDDDMPLGTLTSTIEISTSDKTYELPISLNVLLSSNIVIDVEHNFEILTETQETITIPIENNGTYAIKNITADIEGDLKDYVIGTYTPEIPAGDTEHIEIELDEFEDDGTYTGTINLTINDADYSTTLIVTVFDDFADDIEYLNALRLSLHQTILTLQQEGTYIGDVEESLESLQASINELDSLYASEKYLEAKDLLDTLQTEADEIETSVTVLQAASTPEDNSDTEESIETYCGDGFCDLGESCDCSDCRYEEQCEEIPSSGSSNTFIIIFVVLLVIVGGVVIATSIVPDDWDENK